MFDQEIAGLYVAVIHPVDQDLHLYRGIFVHLMNSEHRPTFSPYPRIIFTAKNIFTILLIPNANSLAWQYGEGNVVFTRSKSHTKEYAMKSVVSVRFLACAALLALVGLGAAPQSAHAEYITDGVLDNFSPQSPLGLRPGCHYGVYSVRLVAGTTYTIDMTSKAVDSYLILAGNGVLIQDDDSGGNLNARIVFTPSVTGTYNIYATTFGRGERGAYRISVLP
jgi:hypothetical protein